MIRDIKTQTLIDTFENKFSDENYKKFVREFFELSSDDFVGQTVSVRNNHHIKSHTHIANYNVDPKTRVAIFSVCLNRGEHLERARTAQRNYVANLLRSSTKFDTAIVAFYAENEPKWRLSFVKLDYDFVAGKEKEYLTPAKRYSYLVGEKEPCHTAQERLLPIFKAEGFKPSIAKIEEAFSVEQVTVDFFNEYCKKYEELYKYLDQNENFKIEAERCEFSTEQFTKKLLGQLSFLYFLQKKGWLGVHAIPRIMNEKQYKNAFYRLRDNEHKEIVSTLFKKHAEDEYHLNAGILVSDTFTDELADKLADCFELDHWGNGEKAFIRHLFDKLPENKNFFDDYLEPLFYEALNKKRGKNSYYKRFNCRIPFLNGGLFKPLKKYNWKGVDFDIPNSFFSNAEGTGALDVFDRYNFTMCEDEPLEREVAVDPEMLGKIFENLLDAKDRKSKGAFYTPREIVHYMCNETLSNYLANKTGIPYEEIKEFVIFGDNPKVANVMDNENIIKNADKLDEALKSIKVADPAVGSGAFPLGMLSEIVKLRNTLSKYIIENMYPIVKEASESQKKQIKRYRAMEYEKRNQYDLKLETIQNSIFAVDIEASAVDIAKLRLWLSLVVDENLDPTQEQQQLGDHKQADPRPLPNLDYNIMCGNSLVDEFEGIKLFDERLLNKKDYNTSSVDIERQMSLFGGFQKIIDDLLEDLFRKQEALFGEQDNEKKEKLIANIESNIDEIIRAKLNGENNTDGLAKYEECLKQKTKPFFLWKLYFGKIFKENGGFDVVIGNPPYVGEEGNKSLFRDIASTEFGKMYYTGKMDLWYFFTSRAIELIKDKGIVSYIAPNNWMTTTGGKKMRKHMLEQCKICKFVTFKNYMVFETASQQTMIFVLTKKKMNSRYNFPYSEFDELNISGISLGAFLNSGIGGINYITEIDPLNCMNGESIQFLNNQASFTLDKIKKAGIFTFNSKEILNGIHPHHACVTKKMLPLLAESKVGDGIFVLTIEEYDSLEFSEQEKGLLKPCYTSNNIKKYYYIPEYRYKIIYTSSEFKNKTIMEQYPKIKKHLDKYVNVITSDNKPYGLHRARQQDFFEEPKIVSLRKCKEPTFTYIGEPAYVMAEYYVIKSQRINLRYAVGILNSSVIKYWLKNMGKMQGDNFQMDKEPLLNIPIVLAEKTIENNVISIVDQIIKIKQADSLADTVELEEQIDKIVYELYGLTEEEIRIVEESVK